MTKEVLYTYLGTNGTITSPVHLEDIYYTVKYRLTADKNKVLTKDNEHFFNTVFATTDDLEKWSEVEKTE